MCKFCKLVASGEETIASSEHFVVLNEIAPVSPGHTLILSKRHADDAFALNAEEWADLGNALQTASAAIERVHFPDGYNLGANCGDAAGQTIFHFHLHLIPRYAGDVTQPDGGICTMFRNAPPRHRD